MPPGTTRASHDLAPVVLSLHEQFDAALGTAAVHDEIERVRVRFDGVRIRAFVPLFIRRYAGADLRDAITAQARSLDRAGAPS